MSHVVIIGGSGDIGNSIIQKLILKKKKTINIDIKLLNENSDYLKNIQFDLRELKDQQKKLNLINEITNHNVESIESIIFCSAVQKLGSFKDFKITELEEINFINSISQVEIFKLLLPFLQEHDNPSLISLNSVHKNLTKSNFFSYSSSKKYLEGMLDSLSLSFNDHKVKIIQIFPAAIDTQMLRDGLNESEFEKLNNFHPVKTLGKPKDLASLIIEIMHLKSLFLNGAKINFDGGISNQLSDPSNQ